MSQHGLSGFTVNNFLLSYKLLTIFPTSDNSDVCSPAAGHEDITKVVSATFRPNQVEMKVFFIPTEFSCLNRNKLQNLN